VRNVDEPEGSPTPSKQLLYDLVVPSRVTSEAIGNKDQRDVTSQGGPYRIHYV
jgi:hypothetical protein